MTLNELQWMCELFKSRNMSKAVENLYISQPALSQCLRRIEEQLGFKLFERSNKGLIPTKKGELFYEASLKIVNIYQEFLAQTSRLDREELRSLQIGLPPYLSMMSSMNLLKKLHSAFPEISFSVCESYTDDMKNMLLRNQLQLMITTEPTQIKGAISYPFGRNIPVVIYLRANSPAAQYAYVKNGEQYLDPVYLEREPISITRRGQASRAVAEAVFQECGITPCILQETRHVNTLYSYACEGITSAIGPYVFSPREEAFRKNLIYRIPEIYKCSQIRPKIHIFPEVARLLPYPMIDIIKDCLVYDAEQ